MMTNLPLPSQFIDDSVTEKQFKKAIEQLINHLKDQSYNFDNLFEKISNLEYLSEQQIKDLNDALKAVELSNAGEKGWTDLLIQTITGNTQRQENKAFVTSCFDIDALKDIAVIQDRICQITADNQAGLYKYESASTATPDNFNIVASNKGTGRWVRKTKSNTAFGNAHARRYANLLDWNFPENEKYCADVSSNTTQSTMSPGSFQIDTINREIWLYCALSLVPSGQNSYGYFVVHDLDTSEYKFSYRISLDNGATSVEGFVLTRYFGGVRKGFVPCAGTDKVYEFDLEPSSLPASGSDLSYAKSYEVNDCGEQLAFDEITGTWYIESYTPTIAKYSDRKILVQWSSDFSRVFGHIDVGLHNSGYVSNGQAGGAGQYFHKRQGYAIHGGLIALSFGGGANSNYNTVPTPAYNTNIQGIRLINMSGETIKESFLEPAPHIKKRNSFLGIDFYESEHEGVAWSNGKLYTLEALFHGTYRDLSRKGWAIVEVMTNDPRATDFSDVSSNRCQPNQQLPSFLPRVTNNTYINPLTGAWYSNVSEIFDSMIYLQKPQISFYATGINLNDTDGVGLFSKYVSRYITITMQSMTSFLMTVHGYAEFTYTKNSNGSYTKVGNILNLRAITTGGNLRSQIRGQNYTTTAADVMLLDLQSTPSTNNLIIGGGASNCTGATKILFANGDNSTANTTYLRMQLDVSALSPYTAGGIALGASALPFSNIYSQTAVTVTSDRNYKDDIVDLNEAELATAKACAKLFKRYKLKSSVLEKGSDARYHVGVIAQDVIQAFKSNGLDWTEYGIVTYEKWDGQEEITELQDDYVYTDEGDQVATGNKVKVIIQEAKEAGEKYMVRYEELMCFIMASTLQ